MRQSKPFIGRKFGCLTGSAQTHARGNGPRPVCLRWSRDSILRPLVRTERQGLPEFSGRHGAVPSERRSTTRTWRATTNRGTAVGPMAKDQATNRRSMQFLDGDLRPLEPLPELPVNPWSRELLESARAFRSFDRLLRRARVCVKDYNGFRHIFATVLGLCGKLRVRDC